MRQFLKSGSVRGVRSNPHPYRDRPSAQNPRICHALARVICVSVGTSEARFAVAKPGIQLGWVSDPHLPLQSRTCVHAGETFGESSSESQKFSTSQALLLYVEIVKARFLPSGEANGTPRLELVVHNSETSPFSLTRMIVAACTDELATNQPFPSADQLIPERCFATPKAIEREDPLLS